jgi:hypothetical protein
MVLASGFHLWNALGARLYCPERTGQTSSLYRGGWGDGPSCEYSPGGMSGAEVRPLDLFEPRWSFVLWLGVLIATPVITARLVRSTHRIVDGTTDVRWRRYVRVE